MTRNIIKMLQEYSQDIFFISAVRECHKIKVILVGKKHLFDNEAFIWQWKCMPGFWKFPHKDSRSQKYEDGKSIAYLDIHAD